MKVRYIYSACIEIETKDIRILTDPWFTPGAYDGAWHQFPLIDNPLEIIKEPDVIYISHIHPDHYDPIFLHKLFDKYGKKPVIIPVFENNYLLYKARADGIEVTPIEYGLYGDTHLYVVPNIHGSASDIDSALFVSCDGVNILNLNDCIESAKHTTRLHSIISRHCSELDLLALGYTGAGPYPQTYYDFADPELEFKAEQKKQQFFKRYLDYTKLFPAKNHLPFAGKYLLGGKLAKLNDFRGVADAYEVKEFDPKAIILADKGEGEIDLQTGELSKERKQCYSKEDYEARKLVLQEELLDYESEICISYEKIKFSKLVQSSLVNALRKSENLEDYYFVFNIMIDDKIREKFVINTRKSSAAILLSHSDNLIPRSEYYVDYRHFFGCLTGVYHWNNAEVASFCNVRRTPNIHRPKAQAFLNFLSIC
ncbi:hypothetical protein PESP_a2826 [Pseudoalteromonas espejiana DSM 9414]|uniref:MBL fold metallo-hydrolase n=1 Tax=Pseudoalteromonas espejiana TaxID=28107 RepID=A0A510XQN5_9GAMM|nr:MBL fold metallo-hydrolase [Pseudoalteromonas espejiana]ASM50740.1 hypothetical protein PESP_a2826 [Pseudoalteromonas espejiana DSM 9414]GEK53342.1 hypothetical protein PES01_01870 [Pseudoalteromonas espejiana]